jgi:uncharacterized protein YcbX
VGTRPELWRFPVISSMVSKEAKVGRVAELWRFPVKSFQGELVQVVDMALTGVVGDRRYALRETSTRKILTAKRRGVLMQATARTEGSEVVLTLPNGKEYGADDPGVSEALSAWLGVEVAMEEAAPDHGNGLHKFDFGIGIPPGGFVDGYGAQLLTTASLSEVGTHYSEGTWDTRRFRPTALVDTSEAKGYLEESWLGGTVTLGDAVLLIHAPMPRCVMTTRQQPHIHGRLPLERDKTIFTTITAENGSNLGVGCFVTTAGCIAVGDAVTVSP